MFTAQGYHAAAMDEIADRAGVSKPVLYQHFPGKLELYVALLDQACDTIIDSCREALESTEDNKQRVAATIGAFYDYVGSAEGAFRLVFESDLTSEPAVRERVERVTHECAALTSHVIADDTGLPEEQARLLAVSLVGMAQVSARFWLVESATGAATTAKDDAVALVLRLGLARGSAAIPAATSHSPQTPSPGTSTSPNHSPNQPGGPPVEVKIGVQNAPRELTIDTDLDADGVEEQIATAVAGNGVVSFSDKKGRRVVVPAERLAYVEIANSVTGTVGFRG